MQLDLNQLRELLGAIDRTNISELILKSGDFELTVRKNTGSGDRVPPTVDNASPRVVAGWDREAMTTNSGMAPTAGGVADTAAPLPPPLGTNVQVDRRWREVTSPMVGTFYRASAPDESPFVEVGDRISIGQTVCIIEAMKLMNEIEAEVSGQVMEILLQNGEPVEYGQALMRINPD